MYTILECGAVLSSPCRVSGAIAGFTRQPHTHSIHQAKSRALGGGSFLPDRWLKWSQIIHSNTIIDKFHVIKHANDAVDTVRKQEGKTNELLKGTKYLWLKNDINLTDEQAAWKSELMKASKRLKTGRAYSMRVTLQDIYEQCLSREEAEPRLKKLCSWLIRSRLQSMKELCGPIRDHWNEILNYFEYRLTNAILEGMNSIIQNVKRRARGFRNNEYFETMLYLNCSKLDIDAVIANA